METANLNDRFIEAKEYRLKSVNFDVVTALRLAKASEAYSLEMLRDGFINPKDEITFDEIYPTLTPITPQEIISMTNTEQRACAISMLDFNEFLSYFDHEIIDSKTIVKQNKRWKLNANGEFEEYIETINDKYELIYIKYPVRQSWRNEDRIATIAGVRCSCTTTGRMYFLYIPPIKEPRWNEEPEYPKDAIEAICSTFHIRTKPEAVDKIRRQGDVINVIVKEGYEEDYKCEERRVTVDEYISKFESET